MADTKPPGVFRAPTEFVKCAIDFCPNGCVNLHFGSVVVHLQATDFFALQGTMAEVSAHLTEQYRGYAQVQDVH